jgi:hypothetical protein
MSLTWDMTQDTVWFARSEDSVTGLRLYAVVESLPHRDDWDWSVWLPDGPKLTKRGIARSAVEAATAADEAAEECLRESRGHLRDL